MTGSTSPRAPVSTGHDLALAAGGWTAALGFAIGCVLLLGDLVVGGRSVRLSLLTYVLAPMVIGLGLGIVLVTLLVARVRRRPVGRPFWWRRRDGLRGRLLAGAFAATLAVSAMATCRAVRFSESNAFCGALCHQVMTPEYRAHQAGGHRDTPCADCHIADGVGGFVRAKLYGLEEAYLVVSGSYRTPIATPLDDLPPVGETCASCHHPAEPTGDLVRVRRHFSFDSVSTPSLVEMRMKLGGDDDDAGAPAGIHWHASPRVTVRYWARDRERRDIPYVEVDDGSGSRRVYRRGEIAPPAAVELRVMDCTDCHNRSGHDFVSPAEGVDEALAGGALDRRWPAIKRIAVELASSRYPDLATARRSIEAELRRRYPVSGEVDKARVTAAVGVVIEIYQRSVFPGYGVDPTTYDDQLGHLRWPGCFRCHDGEHRSAEGEAIAGDCETCHEIMRQARGTEVDATVDPATPIERRAQPYQHPGAAPDLHVGALCTDCHGEPALVAGAPSGDETAPPDTP